MFSLYDRPTRLCDGLSRREVLRVGGLGCLGLTLPQLLAANESSPTSRQSPDSAFGRAKNIIFLYLAGGPPQHETFDPKPEAPVEIRGPFQPIQTNIPGIQFCELLPRTAAIADKLAVVRSMATDDNTHSSSSYWVLTGKKYAGGNARTIQPTDWPYFGSIIKRYKPSDVLPPLSTVWIPDIMRLNENVTPAGQTGGFMGSQWDPDRFVGDPSLADYQVQGLEINDLPPLQIDRRRDLLRQVERHFDAARRGDAAKLYGKFQEQAFDLLTSGKAQKAFAVDDEPEAVRTRYGANRWGQCVLLARRLVEAGVRLVHVQWPREPGDNAVDNPLWDTHAQNADRVEDVLCPQFDVGFSALVEDLDQRGLLDETLVVAIGEFGRTPKINAKGGRDHWGPVFSFAMAGAGIRGGQVLGASDKQGGYPVEDRVQPEDLTATLFHLVGINYEGTFLDREGRRHPLTTGRPMFKLLGEKPATNARTQCTGDVSRVPPFDPSITLMQTGFEGDRPLKPATASSRPKGWRADPLLENSNGGFGVVTLEEECRLGLHAKPGATLAVKKGDVAVLAQEVRSPFAGTYQLKVRIAVRADSSEDVTNILKKHFTCRLQLFEFTDGSKTTVKRKELAGVTIDPPVVESDEKVGESDSHLFELEKEFVNPKPGANFSFGLGLGVAIVLEKTSENDLEFAPDRIPNVSVAVSQVELAFSGKQRNEKVKV